MDGQPPRLSLLMDHQHPTTPTSKPGWRTHLALALLIALALLGIARGILFYQPEVLLRAYRQDQPLPLDQTERTARNLRCLGDEIPVDETLGFASDLSGSARLEQLRQVQFALAPRLIEDALSYRQVVAVFSQPLETLPPQLRAHQILLDCENGVFLLRSPLNP